MPDPVATAANLAFVESLYEQYLQDPGSVDTEWQREFATWRNTTNGHATLQPRFTPRSLFGAPQTPGSNGHATLAPPPLADAPTTSGGSLQHRVDQLVRNYRVRGHIISKLNPLGNKKREPEELDPGYYGFTEADMDRPFLFTSTVPGDSTRTLREIIKQMRQTYCRSIGVQFMHIDDLSVRQWLQRRMESSRNTTELTRKEQIRILTRLTDAVIFEEFIQRKFIGAKSFSLEGGESLIPLMDLAFEKAGNQGLQEIVIGMAHRGRLNVLANIIGKSQAKIFREFEDADPELYLGGGDVKYHKGYSGEWRTRGGKNIHLSLCFNPSHLEYVNPVAMGRMRAKQDRSGLGTRGERGMCLLIHGDAAFAGEGVVQETLNLSQLDGYSIGGTVHIVINNQIGFTTSPSEARSTRYATDVAKMLQSPIFHVNGERPEAVAAVVRLAMDFRMEFKRDVVIDMYCYRRRGHNEGDEPSFTQPMMYQKIEERSRIHDRYLRHLLDLGGVTEEDANRIAERRTELLERALSTARSDNYTEKASKPRGLWAGYTGGDDATADDPETGVDAERLRFLLDRLTTVPDTFHIHPKLKRLLKFKKEMGQGKRPLDWASAELTAFASLATQGHRVRLSGQDSQRGTFSQRHAVLHDVQDGKEYTPLQHLSPEQAPVAILNSPLSEAGVLGFDYGYSLDYPSGLIMWEAQFGDFVNAAQVIIDQFITSSEDKWERLSGLVMLLPHGFEGQGPEHSSARLERFLNQCAEDNIQVCQPTTPAQHFHLLRRQVVRRWRKPLIVMTPKSLLRHPKAVSPLEELASGKFRRVLGDQPPIGEDGQPLSIDRKVERVLFCTGKVYYDLLERREKLGRNDVAILRLEQLYPFPEKELRTELERYGDDVPLIWVQEEPVNMGAWQFLKGGYAHRMLHHWHMTRVTRPSSASPATGSKAAHQIEQERLLKDAFGQAPIKRLKKYHRREVEGIA